MASPSIWLCHAKSFLCLTSSRKYSFPSFDVEVPRPYSTRLVSTDLPASKQCLDLKIPRHDQIESVGSTMPCLCSNLIVLDRPALRFSIQGFFPSLVLRHGVKCQSLLLIRCLHRKIRVRTYETSVTTTIRSSQKPNQFLESDESEYLHDRGDELHQERRNFQ